MPGEWSDDLQAVNLTFVNDLDVPEVQVQDIQQQDEYENDSDTERDDEVEFEVVNKTSMTPEVGKSSTCI